MVVIVDPVGTAKVPKSDWISRNMENGIEYDK